MSQICEGKIKLTNKDRANGIIDDSCHNYASQICEDCGKGLCHNHINRDKHKCDDSIKGVHGIWK